MKYFYISYLLFQVTLSFAQGDCQYPLNSSYIFYPNNTQSVPNTNSSFVIAGAGNSRFPNYIAKGTYFILYFSPQNIGNTYSVGTCNSIGGLDDEAIGGSKITMFYYDSAKLIASSTNSSAGGVCVNYTPVESGFVVVLLTTASCTSNTNATNKVVIKRTDSLIIPSNDNPNGAISLSVGTCSAMTPVVGKAKNATHTDLLAYGFSENYSNCSCEGNMPYYKAKDVWFKFNAGVNTNMTVNITGDSDWPYSEPPNYVRVFYSANGTNQFQLVDCRCTSSVSAINTFSLTGLTPNGVYYIAVSTNSEAFGTLPADFAISVVSGNCEPCDLPNINSPIINKGNTATLTASNCTGGSVRWYGQAVGGVVLGTGMNYVTPIMNNVGTFTYFADCVKPNCSAQQRRKGSVVVNDCNSIKMSLTNIPARNTGVLTASNCNGVVNWYDQKTGGSIIATGTTLSITNIEDTAPHFYYAECNGLGCSTEPKSIGIIIVEGSHPIANSPTILKGNSTVLTVSNCIDAFVLWRKGNVDVQSGGYSYTTEVFNSVGIYEYSVFCRTSECSPLNTRGLMSVTVVDDCPSILNYVHPTNDFTSGIITKLASSSSGIITATNWVLNNGTKINYQAKSVLLNPGFRVSGGATFEAKVGGCTN